MGDLCMVILSGFAEFYTAAVASPLVMAEALVGVAVVLIAPPARHCKCGPHKAVAAGIVFLVSTQQMQIVNIKKTGGSTKAARVTQNAAPDSEYDPVSHGKQELLPAVPE